MKLRTSTQGESSTSTPRWVKAFGMIALVVVLLLVILLITRGPGGHGPSRHAPPSSVTDHRVQPP